MIKELLVEEKILFLKWMHKNHPKLIENKQNLTRSQLFILLWDKIIDIKTFQTYGELFQECKLKIANKIKAKQAIKDMAQECEHKNGVHVVGCHLIGS